MEASTGKGARGANTQDMTREMANCTYKLKARQEAVTADRDTAGEETTELRTFISTVPQVSRMVPGEVPPP